MSISPVPFISPQLAIIDENPPQTNAEKLVHVDPRVGFLSLEKQISFSKIYPEKFENAVQAAQSAIDSFGINIKAINHEICPVAIAGDPERYYFCIPKCIYIHHYPLLEAIRRIAARGAIEKPRPEQEKSPGESPTLSECNSPSRPSSPSNEESKDKEPEEEIKGNYIDFSRCDLRE